MKGHAALLAAVLFALAGDLARPDNAVPGTGTRLDVSPKWRAVEPCCGNMTGS
jgi:hypothetical protein